MDRWFSVDDKEYGIKFFTFDPGSKDTIMVDFFKKNKNRYVYEPTKDNSNPFPVYSAVLEATLTYLKTVQPNKLIFTGDVNSGLSKLYKKLVMQIVNRTNYELKMTEFPEVTSFILTKESM